MSRILESWRKPSGFRSFYQAGTGILMTFNSAAGASWAMSSICRADPRRS